ncbi:hypothetical protein FGG78_33545 [Thioclava sp. BHET1]|nr:hypothetical protein FGG78_33545 [Thioclava sp. BHET1]
MDYLNIILFGAIEGITEFLPVSTTAHLITPEHWHGARTETFNIASQAGAILAVKWRHGYIQRHRFTAFAIRRIPRGLGRIFFATGAPR